MVKATLKSLFARKLRLLLTGISIVLGVGFVSGTYVLSDTLTRTFDELFGEINQGIDLAVRAHTEFDNTDTGQGEERDLVPDALLQAVRAVPGVDKAEGDVSGYAQMVDPDGKAITTSGAPTLGVVFGTELDEHALSVKEGRPPATSSEMGMDATTAANHDFHLGDRVTVLFQGPTRTFTLVGIMKFGRANGLAGATLAVFDLSTGQDVLGKSGRFDVISVQLDEGAAPEAVRSGITRILPLKYEVVTGEQLAQEDEESVGEFLGFLSTALLVFAGIALFVGGFIIVNTFNILVAQRTRELALFRALGASRRQVTRSVVLEAAIVGLVASVVGLAAGVGVAVGIQGLFRVIGIDLPASGMVFLPRTAIVGLFVGVGVTVVAALLPARRAASVPPVAAMSEDASWTTPPTSLRKRSLVGGGLVTVGSIALGLGLFGSTGSGLELVGFGAAALFLGIATISPLLARPLASILGRPFEKFRGIPGRIGRENAMRNPRRTAATSGALMVGLAVVGAVSVLAASVTDSAGAAVDKYVGADYILMTQNFVGHSTEVATRLRGVEGVKYVAEARALQRGFAVEGRDEPISGMDADTLPAAMKFLVSEGSLSALENGELLVSDKEAIERRYRVGQVLEVSWGRTGNGRLRVGGFYKENAFIGSYLVSIATYDANTVQKLNVVTLVGLEVRASRDAVRPRIEKVLTDYPNLVLRDQTEFKDEQKKQINKLLGLIYGLLLLAILIAFFGIVNTLALSVYERTRELGLLRAVGMSRRQMRQMIRYEAVVIAVLGAVLGLAVGTGLGTALVTALHDDGITEMRVPIGQMVAFLLLAGVAGVIAAALPARRAARLNVLEAISHS